jgi:protein-S-isoprenylcysteine O-methyltransferase Ste14
MAGVALVLLAAFGGVALVLRILIQLRRTGSSGYKGLAGRPLSVEWTGGVLFAVAIALAVSGSELDFREALDPIGSLDGGVGHTAGIVLAAGGLLGTVGAQLAMGDAWRIGVDPSERTGLVTDGPFSIARNPIYSSMVTFFVGIALLVPNVMTIAGAILLILSLELQTRLVEEPYLSRIHGEAYTEYAARVGRFVPGMGRLRGR